MAAMVSSSIPASIPPGEYVPTADQRIVLHGCSWADFQTLLAVRGERRYRMAYLDGVVEIMGASRGHEGKKSMIGRLLEAYCVDRASRFLHTARGITGSRPDEAAAEPRRSATCSQADLKTEVVARSPRSRSSWTSGGIDEAQDLYRLGIDEVWFSEARRADRLQARGPNGYEPRVRSVPYSRSRHPEKAAVQAVGDRAAERSTGKQLRAAMPAVLVRRREPQDLAEHVAARRVDRRIDEQPRDRSVAQAIDGG